MIAFLSQKYLDFETSYHLLFKFKFVTGLFLITEKLSVINMFSEKNTYFYVQVDSFEDISHKPFIENFLCSDLIIDMKIWIEDLLGTFSRASVRQTNNFQLCSILNGRQGLYLAVYLALTKCLHG